MAFERSSDLAQELQKDIINEEAVAKLGERQCSWLFETFLGAASTTPKYTTVRVNTLIATIQEVVDHLNTKLPQDDVYVHPALTDLVVIASRSRNSARPGFKEVIVGVKCAEAVLRGADVYAPGVLASPSGLQADDLVSVYADLEGKCLRGATKPYEGEKMFVGNGVAACSRHDLFVENKTSGTAIRMTDPIVRNPSFDQFRNEGTVFLQNLPSVVCGHVLGPRPGECVLDMCAAPGGKTTHLAALMDDQGVIVALDKTRSKVRKLLDNVSMLRTTCVRVFMFDATKSCELEARPRTPDFNLEKPPFPRETFDRILLDAPCSALGQRPQLRNTMKAKELLSYPRYQRLLLQTAAQLLKPGGVLVYSTCTVTLAENEMQVKWLLEHHPEMRLSSQEPRLGGPGFPGAGLTEEELQCLQRFGPAFISREAGCATEDGPDRDTIGFFIAKFVKSVSCDQPSQPKSRSRALS